MSQTEIITTKSIGAGIADIEEDFILCEEAMSRLIFHAQIHNGGISGRIIRQRRESNCDTWVPEKAIDIRTLGKNETINLELNTEAVKLIYSAILKVANILKQKGIGYGENKYKIVDPNTFVVTDENKAVYIKKLLEAGYDEEIWNNIAESNPTLITKLSYARVQLAKQNIIAEFSTRLQNGDFSETAGPDSWQKWIYKNNWLFGVNYKEPIEKTKINLTGVMPDYLFPTIDGFMDILEIKLPNDEVVIDDKSHPGSWKWSNETNVAIGQVVNYLSEIDRLRFEIEKSVKIKYGFEICILKPRAYILIGNNYSWDSYKKEGLRKMNYALHGIEVLTYNDLKERGNQAINSNTFNKNDGFRQ